MHSVCSFVAQVLCTACHPYSFHFYERLGTGLTMAPDFCAEFFEECSGPDQLDLEEGFCDYDQLDLEEGFCDYHATQTHEYWSYPLPVLGEELEDTPGVCKRVLQYHTTTAAMT